MSDTAMTSAEQNIADDKMRAEIAKLIAESAKINAETGKINAESRWYPLVIGTGLAAGLMTAGGTIAKFLFGL